jgi:ferrous iron transport protein B
LKASGGETEHEARTVALIGNPNTGKSTLFGALSGARQRVGNYPGVTVEKKLGWMSHAGRRWTLVDLPGTYSLAPRSPDEMVAIDVLLGRRGDVPTPDVVLCVVDASNLERNLYLLSQVLELGRPAVVALTMTDVARARGVEIDVGRLSANLGVPVVPVRGDRREGLDALKAALADAAVRPAPACVSPFPQPFRDEVERLEEVLSRATAGVATVPASGSPVLAPGHEGNGAEAAPLPRFLVERLLLDTGGYFEGHLLTVGREPLRAELVASRRRLLAAGCPVPAVEAMARYGWVGEVVEGVVKRPEDGQRRVTVGDRIDAVLTHRVWGTVVLAATMLVMFNAVFTWAEVPMGWIEAAVRWLSGLVESQMAEGPFRALLSEGVIGGIGAVVIFLPQIVILFMFLAVLEDCGYLARAAFLMDRLMSRLGLSGKSFIPLLSSFACAIPGVMAARVIENRRDRLTTILVAPLMSCSARLPVYTLLIAAFIPDRRFAVGLIGLRGLTLSAMYFLGIIVAAAAALVLKRTLLRGATPPFVMELPAYKWPSPRVVFHRVIDRAWDFLYRAGTLILAVSVLMWAALYYPRLSPSSAAPLKAEQQRLRAERDRAASAGSAELAANLEADLARVSDRLEGAQKRQSLLGRAGRLIEPAVRPLGWDWRIGSAALASFPAREVVVASLGVIFDVGKSDDAEGESRLSDALRSATWPDTGLPLFNTPVALSIMVFFALCAQCASTLAVIRRETGSWWWSSLSFTYMTVLAYLGALVTYQVGMLLVG